ncbi:hypothetical protein PT974_02045 [Cladobotryum mycophilum]|uniref:Uncharacterized protein n=1 Tax=Cladobotryum mycophilum TaxID=491253 RepID=A0ABR0SY70_9HYPO
MSGTQHLFLAGPQPGPGFQSGLGLRISPFMIRSSAQPHRTGYYHLILWLLRATAFANFAGYYTGSLMSDLFFFQVPALPSLFPPSEYELLSPIMEGPSRSRPDYEKVSNNDLELESDEGTVTPTTSWPRRRKQRTLLSTLWLCTRVVLIAASVIAWAASLWLTHLAGRELGQARGLVTDLGQEAKPEHKTPAHAFITGATLPAAGYGLVYNTSYCNGWEDPEGAKARGCVLDPTQGGWIHELCHDPALVKEWLKLPDFGWYLDPKKKQRISQEKVWAADIPGGVMTELYTAMDFHVQHCQFVMRLRIKHAMRKNRGLGYIPLDPSHMTHCLGLMTEEGLSEHKKKELTQVVLGKFGGGTEGFGLGGECYMPIG